MFCVLQSLVICGLCKKCALLSVIIWYNVVEFYCFAIIAYEEVMVGQLPFNDKVFSWCYLYMLLCIFL